MRRAATIITNEPVRLTREEHQYMVKTAQELLDELTIQKPGWMGRSASLTIGLFRTFQGAVRRGRRDSVGDVDA